MSQRPAGQGPACNGEWDPRHGLGRGPWWSWGTSWLGEMWVLHPGPPGCSLPALGLAWVPVPGRWHRWVRSPLKGTEGPPAL